MYSVSLTPEELAFLCYTETLQKAERCSQKSLLVTGFLTCELTIQLLLFYFFCVPKILHSKQI